MDTPWIIWTNSGHPTARANGDDEMKIFAIFKCLQHRHYIACIATAKQKFKFEKKTKI
jgi:hypothetical protein